MLWFEHMLEWQKRFVMLESAKDRVLGVETLGQQVPPRIWYGIACLLSRDVVESVSYSVE
jgi:hypothetical protein